MKSLIQKRIIALKLFLNPIKQGGYIMMKQGIAPHESIELHEILTFKNVCLTKSIAMSKLISDNELKSILEQDISTTQQHIRELTDLMRQSVLLDNVEQNVTTS
jgi:similar to spore coat protein